MAIASPDYQVRTPLFDRESLRLPVLGYSLGRLTRIDRMAPGETRPRDYYQLCWVEEGVLRVTVAGRGLDLTAGQAAVLPKGPPVAVTCEGPCRRHVLKFRGSAVVPLLRGFGIRLHRAIAAGAPPAAVFERLRQTMQDVTPAGASRASACTYELLACLARKRADPSVHPLVARAQGVIEASLADAQLNVTALAARLGVHRTRLAQRFRAEIGMSPGEYLRRCRVREALALLEGSDLRIAEVGARCGYPEPSQFGRFIRQATGMSPREARRSG